MTGARAKAANLSPDAGRVAIVMGLYDGADCLQAQLDSFAAQSHGAWDLLVSDDGSRDEGPSIVRDFARQRAPHGNDVTLIEGPGQGFALNYLHLLDKVTPRADWLAFSDQDDVWLEDRLARGIGALRALQEPAGTPALYCSRSWVSDAALENRRPSRAFPRPPAFANALIENIAPGNTILLNRAALELAQRAGAAAHRAGADRIYAHDWWLYQLVSGAGGTVIHDPEPTLIYRQHGGNAIGHGGGVLGAILQPAQVLAGRFRTRVSQQLGALEAARDELSPEARACLQQFSAARAAPLPARIAGLRRAGVWRQRPRGAVGFWGAALLGRV